MNEELQQIENCEVCGNVQLEAVLDLGYHPMCDDLVSVGESSECRESPIEILYCNRCYTAHQRFQIPKQELFPSTYHYRARFTADVLNGMAALVESCEIRLGSLVGKKVLDIGCNDGSLLDYFKAKGATTVGIEPTDAFKDAQQKGHATFNGFLSEKLASAIVATHGRPDIITFTNVFAHISDLPEVLRALNCLRAPHTNIVIENHYLGAVLAENQFDTFYHEHPRTYSYTSFVYIAQSLDLPLADVEFPSRYGGNIRVYLGHMASTGTVDIDELTKIEGRFRESFRILQEKIEIWRNSKKRLIDETVRLSGKLRAKAFPGRAAIIVKLLNLDEQTVSAVYEKPGSLKIGHYVPGTRIPIKSDSELFDLPDQTKPILNLAWHIPSEIREYLLSHKYTGSIIDVVQVDDFIREE